MVSITSRATPEAINYNGEDQNRLPARTTYAVDGHLQRTAEAHRLAIGTRNGQRAL